MPTIINVQCIRIMLSSYYKILYSQDEGYGLGSLIFWILSFPLNVLSLKFGETFIYWPHCTASGVLVHGMVALTVKNPPAIAEDVRNTGLIPELGWSPGGGHGNPLQYSCLENPMDRGAWRAIVHRIKKSRTWLKRLSMHARHGSDPCPLQWKPKFLTTGVPTGSLCCKPKTNTTL